MKVRLQDFILPAVIFACAFLIRYISFNLAPPLWDEAVYIHSGQLFINLISQGKFFDPQWWYDYDVPPVGCYLIGIALWIAGYRTPIPPTPAHYIPAVLLLQPSILETARFVNVVLSSLTCVNIFYLGRTLRKTRIGLAAAWIWAFDPFSITLGRFAMLESIMAFFLTLSLIAFFQGMKRRGLKWIGVSGLFFGLAAGTKMFGWLEIPILAICIIFLWLRGFSGHSEKDSSPIRIHLYYLFVCSVVGVTIFFVSWPLLWLNTVKWPLAFLKAQETQKHLSPHLESLDWIFILFRRCTVPEVALAIWGLVVASWNFLNRKTIFLGSLATSWFILTLFFLTFFEEESFWYFFIVTPSIALLASVGFENITERLRIRQKPVFITFLAGIVALHALVVLWFYPFYFFDTYDNLELVSIGGSHMILGIFSLIVFICLLVLFLVIPRFWPQVRRND